jgi:glycerophosphoryl diester phosphodiesterase
VEKSVMHKDTIKIHRKHVKMVAHRGMSGLERENTNVAFVAAGNRSYFGIETDIHRTADGKFVVIHDGTTKRVSGGAVDVNVEEVSYDVLKDIVLPDLDGSTARNDIRIPLLPEYVHICKKYDKVGVLELKNSFAREELQEIVEIIKEQDYLDGIIFISFDWNNCVVMREILPKQPIQWLTGDPITAEKIQELVEHKLDLDIYYGALKAEDVAVLHEKNIEVNCWTCDNDQHAQRLIDMGVDFITTNILE